MGFKRGGAGRARPLMRRLADADLVSVLQGVASAGHRVGQLTGQVDRGVRRWVSGVGGS